MVAAGVTAFSGKVLVLHFECSLRGRGLAIDCQASVRLRMRRQYLGVIYI